MKARRLVGLARKPRVIGHPGNNDRLAVFRYPAGDPLANLEPHALESGAGVSYRDRKIEFTGRLVDEKHGPVVWFQKRRNGVADRGQRIVQLQAFGESFGDLGERLEVVEVAR